jgi:hypothetical protein
MQETARKALNAYLLADELLDIYQREQVPLMVQNFVDAGFTKDTLSTSPESIYGMVVLAAYDRRPFYRPGVGYEAIWGISTKDSVKDLLLDATLMDTSMVCSLGVQALAEQLAKLEFQGQSLQSGGGVSYAKTSYQAATKAKLLLRQVTEASTEKEVRDIFNQLDSIHGIGETIASKVVKYMLREIRVGRVTPDRFPLDVVWPITNEFHIQEAVKLIGNDISLIALTQGILLSKGDPFAIDAIFYLHRYYPQHWRELCESLMSDLQPRLPPQLQSSSPVETQNEFHEAMLDIYKRALAECHYKATVFLQMVNEMKGLQAAKVLLSKKAPQYGLTKLWECKRLDLSVEALVLKPQFRNLFSNKELEIARDRLTEYGYFGDRTK